MAKWVLLAFLLIAAPASWAERATARYAPVQLRVAQDLLDRARAAAVLGDLPLAGKLAWQANLDARLAWAMSDSTELRADAAEVGGAAATLINQLARRAER
jgi:hypothetical protein